MEHQQPIIERVADLEASVRELLRTISQLQREPKLVHPQPIEWVQTKGKTIVGYYYDDESDYPEQDVDCPQYELPAVFLNGKVPEDVCDDFIWTPRSATPQTRIISPGGWIPEFAHLPVYLKRDGRYQVLYVPELRVVALDAIAPDEHGTVKLWRGGEETDQEFEAWNDWLHGGTTIEAGKQCLAMLQVDVRHWSVSAGVEC